jgi:DNA-binding XRE family transcriptional regulator
MTDVGTRIAWLFPSVAKRYAAMIGDPMVEVLDGICVHLGKRLRSRRRMLGLTQGQLAALCGVRFQQIQKYETGANTISAPRLWLLAAALDVPVGYFYDGLAAAAAVAVAKPDERGSAIGSP